MYYVNYLSQVNYKFDRADNPKTASEFVSVFDNAHYMIFEVDAGLMKALAQETTADVRFPS